MLHPQAMIQSKYNKPRDVCKWPAAYCSKIATESGSAAIETDLMTQWYSERQRDTGSPHDGEFIANSQVKNKEALEFGFEGLFAKSESYSEVGNRLKSWPAALSSSGESLSQISVPSRPLTSAHCTEQPHTTSTTG